MAASQQEVIDILNSNLSLEHESILQYLLLAWALGGDAGATLEGIAREEMLHLKWLAWAIVENGGTPNFKPPEAGLGGRSPLEILQAGAQFESQIIDDYRRQIAQIDDPKVNRLLERLIVDSERHRTKINKLIADLEVASPPSQSQAESAHAVPGGEAAELPETTRQAIELLNADFREEYGAILQYLWQYFTTRHCPASKRFEDKAIQEMKHMGWLGEKVMDLGGQPTVVPGHVALDTDLVQMLQNDIQGERAAQIQYQAHIDAIDDPGIKALLSFIKQHEVFHEASFQDLLKEVTREQKPQSPVGRLTVGSLLGQAQ